MTTTAAADNRLKLAAAGGPWGFGGYAGVLQLSRDVRRQNEMKRRLGIIVVLSLAGWLALAGDDASGPIQYSVDLGQPFAIYQLTEADRTWVRSLTRNLRYSGRVVHFVRSSLPLIVNGRPVEGAVYQAIEHPEYFYVAPGDAMLKLDTQWAFSPGVGGFSMHAPRSRHFIACLNLPPGGIPFLSSGPVTRGRVSWGGHDYKRF